MTDLKPQKSKIIIHQSQWPRRGTYNMYCKKINKTIERWLYQHPAMFHFGLRSNKRAGGRQLFSKSGGGGNEEETIDTWLLWSGERHMLHLRWNQGTTIFDTLKGLTWCILVKLNQNIWSWNCITVKCPSEPKQWNLQQWPMSLLWEVSKMLDLFLSICFSTPAGMWQNN